MNHINRLNLLSIPDVARLLGINHNSLRKAIDNGSLLIPYEIRKMGKTSYVVFKPSIVKKYIPKPWRIKDAKPKVKSKRPAKPKSEVEPMVQLYK